MSCLLDTHSLLWAIFEPKKLGKKARAIIEDRSDEVFVSPLSYWEISLKAGLGKLVLPDTDPSEIPDAARETGFAEAPLDSDLLATCHRLPFAPGHRDPFDRLLVWQAIRERRVFLSRDPSLPFFEGHGLRWAW